jgi:tellurite resistance protein TehA-like permease
VNRRIVQSGTLLCIPVAFLLSAETGHPIWPTVFGHPLFLLATALGSTALALYPFFKVEIKDRAIQFSLKLPPFANIAVATVALCTVTVLVGYGFVENFAAR